MVRNSKSKCLAPPIEGELMSLAKKAKNSKHDSIGAASSSSCLGSASAAATPVTPVPTSLTSDTINAAHKLIDLAKTGSWDDLFSILDGQKALVNIRPEVREYSVLHQAAYLGQCEAVNILLTKYGADPSQLTKHGQSAIEVAKDQGHTKIVELLSAGSPQQSKESSASTSLTPEKLERPKDLVTEMPTFSSDIISGAHRLIDHAKAGRWQELYDMLDKQKELVNVRPDVREYSALHQAAFHNNKDVLLTLINKYGADPSLTTGWGLTLLEVAESQGAANVVEALMKLPLATAGKPLAAEEDETDDEFEMKLMPDGSWKVIQKGSSESPGAVTPPGAAACSSTAAEPRLEASAPSVGATSVAATSTKKGPPVDVFFPAAEKCSVCRHDGAMWHALLKKANQFFLMQLVEVNEDSYCIWSRWGKVDTDGQHEATYFASPELAAAAFKAKFYETTYNKWEKRKVFKPFFAKYVYMVEPGIDDDVAAASSGGIAPTPLPRITSDIVQEAHKLLDLAKAGRWPDLLKALDVHKTLVNVRPEAREFSVLHQAAFQGNVEVVVRLIDEYGADPSQCTKLGKTVTQVAEDKGYSQIAEEVRSRLPKIASVASD